MQFYLLSDESRRFQCLPQFGFLSGIRVWSILRGTGITYISITRIQERRKIHFEFLLSEIRSKCFPCLPFPPFSFYTRLDLPLGPLPPSLHPMADIFLPTLETAFSSIHSTRLSECAPPSTRGILLTRLMVPSFP